MSYILTSHKDQNVGGIPAISGVNPSVSISRAVIGCLRGKLRVAGRGTWQAQHMAKRPYTSLPELL